MPTTQTSTRFEQIVQAAGLAFARTGWKRTQMADIAKEAGVALGTLYGYSASKEALFESAFLRAVGVEVDELWQQSHSKGAFKKNVLDWAREHFADRTAGTSLEAALLNVEPDDARSELRVVIGELYDVIESLQIAIRMLDRSTNEWPQLEALFVDKVRGPVVQKLMQYLESRVESRHFPDQGHIDVTARMILESCSWMAMHRQFTSGGPVTTSAIARETTVRMLVGGVFYPDPNPCTKRDSE